MKLPRNLPGTKVIKILIKHYNWEIYRREGSHVTLKKKNEMNIVTVPLHGSLLPGTFLSIIRKANIDREDFLKKL